MRAVGRVRRRGDWRTLGEGIEPEAWLSRGRARDLRLALAWTAAAGERARCARRVELRRGTLELEAEDAASFDALASALPEIVARLAEQRPELGVRAYRLRDGSRERRARVDPCEG